MIELPEARIIAKDLKSIILNKKIVNVDGNFTDHKFTFYYEDPDLYYEQLINKKITKIIERNYYVEIEIEDYKLILRDGANIRYYDDIDLCPDKSKFRIVFSDYSCLNVTTSMYCCIFVFKKDIDINNLYYNLELNGIGALDPEFTFDYFQSLLNEKTLKLSTKAFLATDQRILGIGNGVVQDILFNANILPKRKMNTLNFEEIEKLYNSIIATIHKMIELGGRDTEKNIFSLPGRYKTILSSKTYKNPCPCCKGTITKENYLGGSIYYCSNCQK